MCPFVRMLLSGSPSPAVPGAELPGKSSLVFSQVWRQNPGSRNACSSGPGHTLSLPALVWVFGGIFASQVQSGGALKPTSSSGLVFVSGSSLQKLLKFNETLNIPKSINI